MNIQFKGVDEDGYTRAVVGHTMYRCDNAKGVVEKLEVVRGGPSVWKRTRGQTAEKLLLATYINALMASAAP